MFKGMCYIFLILGFLLFFNKDPLFCVVIVAVAVGLYAFFKLRKKGKGRSSGFFGGFLSSRSPIARSQNSEIADLMKFMVVQQMLSNPQQTANPLIIANEQDNSDEESELEKEKQAILKLLEVE